MFGRKKETEVFITNNLELYTIVHQALEVVQIPYEVEIVNIGAQNRRTGTLMDRVDEWLEPEIQYYIHTPREYVEGVKYMTNEYRKSSSW